MFIEFLILAQAVAPKIHPETPESIPELSVEQALATMTQVKLSIQWSDKERAYVCTVKESSGNSWIDTIPCSALKKCEKGRAQKQEELMPCFYEQAGAIVEQALNKAK